MLTKAKQPYVEEEILLTTHNQEKRLPKNSWLAHMLGRFLLWLSGWKLVGELPPVNKAVFITAPHTSNWDGYFFLVIAAVLRLRISFTAKNSLFIFPLGWFFRLMGGIPINRKAKQGIVQQMSKEFDSKQSLALAVPPAGTRSYSDHWKSGFYRIATAAKVPVICAFLDYKSKQGGIGPTFNLSHNLSQDMDQIRLAYAGIEGKHPQKVSRIVLKEELQQDENQT